MLREAADEIVLVGQVEGQEVELTLSFPIEDRLRVRLSATDDWDYYLFRPAEGASSLPEVSDAEIVLEAAELGTVAAQPGAEPEVCVWPPWLNRDTPEVRGDYEVLKEFVARGEACESPVKVECRTREGHVVWMDTGQSYDCTPTDGGVCHNRGQSCLDDEIRFCC